MANKKLYKTKKNHKLSKPDSATLRIVLIALIAIAVAVSVCVIVKKKSSEDHTYVPDNELDKYEYYVGPKDHSDRGLWTTAEEYYSLFGKDAKETDLVKALFGTGEKKGLVPVGIRVTPVMLSYDDFEPYSGPMQYGYMDAYSVRTTADGTELFSPVEYKYGLEEPALNISGAYNITKGNTVYESEISLNVLNAEYYVCDIFDPDADGESIGVAKSDYGFLTPYFNYDYDGYCKSAQYDNGKLTGTKEIQLSGRLDDCFWEFTSNLTGQNKGLFKTGSIYIHCKLPCVVNYQSFIDSERTENRKYDSFVNLYLRIDELMIGTWADCER